MKLPIEEHRMKWPHLERNVYIAIFIIILLAIALGIYRMEIFERRRAAIQNGQEQLAIYEHKAVDTSPSPKLQKIPGWAFEARKRGFKEVERTYEQH